MRPPLVVLGVKRTGARMGEWDDRNLVIVNDGDEVEISARREDGSLRDAVVIWSVRLGRHLYVRSARGPEGRWYRNLMATGRGRVAARGICQDVIAESVDPTSPLQASIDGEYERKYGRFGSIVDSVTGPSAAYVTLRLTPETP